MRSPCPHASRPVPAPEPPTSPRQRVGEGRRSAGRFTVLFQRGLLALAIPACGSDSPDPDAAQTQSTGTTTLVSSASDFVPSLGIPGLGTGPVPELGAQDWQPSFEPTPTSTYSGSTNSTSPAAGTSTGESAQDSTHDSSKGDPTSSSSTQSDDATASSGSTSSDTLSSSTQSDDSSSDDTPGNSTPSDDSTASDPQTSDPTDSESGETDEPPNPIEIPPLDPNGPQFGLQLDLQSQGPALTSAVYRALIFEFDVRTPESETPRADPELFDLSPWPLQPRLTFTASGRASLILSPPDLRRIDPDTGQSKPHAIAIYRDRDDNGAWSDNETFVAILPNSFIYEPATFDHPERWRMTPTRSGAQRVQDLLSPEIPLVEIPSSLDIERLDAGRSPVQIGGPFKSVAHRGVDFLALISEAERKDLQQHFWTGHRPADVYLRGKNTAQWQLTAQGLPAGRPGAAPLLKIPGIKPQFTATNWLVGYRRPVGAPLEGPTTFLTPESEILAGVCRGRDLGIGFWIQGGAWADSPAGPLYASWFGLGEGWGFVVADTRSAPFYYYPYSYELDLFGVSPLCLPEQP